MRYLGMLVLLAVLCAVVGCKSQSMSEAERKAWRLKLADRTSESSTDTSAVMAERLREDLQEEEAKKKQEEKTNKK